MNKECLVLPKLKLFQNGKSHIFCLKVPKGANNSVKNCLKGANNSAKNISNGANN